MMEIQIFWDIIQRRAILTDVSDELAASMFREVQKQGYMYVCVYV